MDKNLKVDVKEARLFLEDLRRSIQLERIADLVGAELKQIELEVDMSLAEALQTVSMLHGHQFRQGAHALEVGAGFGFASLALASFGYQVTALEPGGIGFEKNRTVAAHLISLAGLQVRYLDATVEQADLINGPKFDLIFSNNVLEHVHDVHAGLANLAGALDAGGFMVHSCPNYAFPFEPHFGIPLIPLFPRLTRLVIPRKIAKSDLWASLNFISYRQVAALARAENLFVSFERGTIVASVTRLRSDAEFARRHKLLGRLAGSSFFFAVIRRFLALPVFLASPMNFVLSREMPDLAWTGRQWRITGPKTPATSR